MHPRSRYAAPAAALVLAAGLAGCGSSSSGSGNSSGGATFNADGGYHYPASDAAGPSCKQYLGTGVDGRMAAISAMAGQKHIARDRATIVSWELTALSQCQIYGGNAGQYVGPNSNLVPDSGDPAAGALEPK